MTRKLNIEIMKRILLFLLLFTGMAEAQVINFTDPNLKTAILNSPYVVDLNGNFLTSADLNFSGDIEMSEASQIGTLIIENGNISNLSGMEFFTNLKELSCADNQITTLAPLQNLVSLQKLFIQNNQVAVINLSGFNLLDSFTFSGNPVSSLNLSGCSSLGYLDLLNMNNLTYLNVNGCSSLPSVTSNSPLVFLDVTGCNTQTIFVNYSQLTSLNLSNITVPVVSLSYNPLLSNITFGNNSPNITNLTILEAPITNLDLSAFTSLTSLWCTGNTALQTIFMKNGQNESTVLTGNTNLQFVCADDSQVAAVQNELTTQGLTNVVCNSYCDFTPGGNYNTLSGLARMDLNNNGCDNADFLVPFLRLNVSLNGVSTNSSAFSNENGLYTLYTTTPGIYQLDAAIENPSWFNTSPVTANMSVINNSSSSQNICLSPIGVHTDLEVVIEPVTPARPGFNAVYKLVYKNKGNTTPGFNSGVHLEYDPNKMSFVSASQAWGSQGSNYIHFDYSNLRPFETRSILVTFLINSPTASNPVNIGDILAFNATVGLNIGDENFDDNIFPYNQTVVGSFDPNDITCIEGPVLAPSQIGKYLHYAVNFENTGSYQAENVVVADVIDTNKYDISSLQLMNTSHPSYIKITGNKVEFIFENINLAAAAGNPPVGGHGNVLFKIKSKNNLVANDFVSKSARIYFDYNAPITTNNAQTTFQALSNSIFTADDSIVVYPNPATTQLNIKAANIIQSAQLYDIQGRLLETSLENADHITLDLSNRQSGIYFVKITSDKGSKVEKVVKE